MIGAGQGASGIMNFTFDLTITLSLVVTIILAFIGWVRMHHAGVAKRIDGQGERLDRHDQRIQFVPFQPFPRFEPQVQFQRAVDAIDALMVPWVPFDVAQMKETQTKTPSLAGIGQPDQQIGDLFVLVLQLRAVAITGVFRRAILTP